jgi:hypothetical protein
MSDDEYTGGDGGCGMLILGAIGTYILVRFVLGF